MPVCGENSSEHNSEHAKSDAPPTHVQRVGSAMFYAISSILIVFVNKSVLTVYEFPSPQVLGMGQMTAACVVLGALKVLGKIDFPDLNKDTPRKIFPLPLLYLLNLVFGLKSTKVFNSSKTEDLQPIYQRASHCQCSPCCGGSPFYSP